MPRRFMTRSERNFMFSSKAYKASHPRHPRKSKAVTEVDTIPVAPTYHIFSYGIDGEFERGFVSINQAKEALQVNDVSHIYKVLNGKRRIAFGHMWSKQYVPNLLEQA